MNLRLLLIVVVMAFLAAGDPLTAAEPSATDSPFPRSLDSYGDANLGGILDVIFHRIREESFNLAATLIFFTAIIHKFMAGKFMALSHRGRHEHEENIRKSNALRHSVHFKAEVFHFLGEVEVIFSLWAVALIGMIVAFYGWPMAIQYIGQEVNFTEAAFVVVIMMLAAKRPILKDILIFRACCVCMGE